MSAFTPAGSGGAPGPVITIEGATNPLISNVLLNIAATEVGILLPAGCKQFLIRLRDALSKLQISYESGASGTTYLTLSPGCFYSDSDLSITGITLYVQSPSASQVVELVTWT